MVLAWILQHKLVLLLSVALSAFTISTITLAVQKIDVETQLRSCFIENEQLNEECATATTTTVTTTTTITTTVLPTESTTPPTTLPPQESYRLPTIVIPLEYELQLVPDIWNGTFSGSNRINMNVTGSTNVILLHSNGLKIETVIVEYADGWTTFLNTFDLIPRVVPSTGLDYDDEIYVTIAFSGSMLDRIVGLYSSSYLNEQLQPSAATNHNARKYPKNNDRPVDAIPSFSDNSLIIANNKSVILKPTLKINVANNSGAESEFEILSRMMINVPKMSKVIEHLNWRLPKEIKPNLCEVTLKPDFKTKTFSGNISIHLDVVQPISFIAVHANTLSVTKTLLERKLNGSRSDVPYVYSFAYPKFEYWVIEVSQPLEIGEYILGLSVNGSLENRIVGFYQSSYINRQTNESRFMATSKFEPTYARQAFPCFDEPSMKAKYKISLVHPTGDGYHALSNMPEESSVTNVDGTTTVHFRESVRMSSYLACFIVSDFAFKEKQVYDDLTMRVFATPAQLNKTDFALDTGVNITRFYIDFFKVPYPLPKLGKNFIAFEVYDKDFDHQQLFNLVTMAWWDELWLNEGFASYIQYKGTDFAYPKWKMMEQFLIDTLHSVLNLDATLASHTIVQIADTPDQITELFDTITYNKGAAIIRMLEHFVGEENFQLSVTSYLKNHEYSNAVTDDLLTEIDNLNLGFDVRQIFQTWTRQMGFPVVNVEKRSETQYRLTQTRFFSNPENAAQEYTDSPFNYRWYIPITYQTDTQNTTVQEWFSNEDMELLVNVPTAHQWIKFNKDQVGYYRVNYPVEMWTSFTTVLKANVDTFSISDRGHLINDAFSLAEATLLGYDIALHLTSYLVNEVEYVPWSVASTNILGLKNQLYYTQQFSKFSKFGQSVIQQVYQSVGWNVDDDHLKNQLRTTVLNFACSIGLPSCIDEAGDQFNAWLANTDVRPNPDLRNLVYYYGMASVGNEEKWDQVWEVYKAEGDAQEKAKLMYGLSGIQVPWILKRFVDLAWDESNVRGQDYFTCLQNIAANRIGESVVWDYVRDNWEKLVARFGLNERYLGRMIPAICGRFDTNTKLEEVRQFFAKYPEAGAGAAAREQTIQNIQNQIKWLENNEQKVANWLNANY